MRTINPAKLLIVFAVAFSLAALPVPLAGLSSIVPSVPVTHALTALNVNWIPGGPSMDTLVYKIYSDDAAEFTGLQAKEFDINDWPLTPALIAALTPSSDFYVTSPISDTGYFEVQYHNDANYWGCNFNFGNSACGINIRQGISHGIDKAIFTATHPSIAGVSVPIDNPVPPAVDLVLPNSCNWDALFPQSGSNCVVGNNGLNGGVAYHLASAVACGLGSCASTPSYAWVPGLGTADFCAAADHFIAAGLATGASATVSGGKHVPGTGTCVLTGIQPGVTANTNDIYVRSDNPPRFDAGNSLAQFICGLFTGTFSTGCSPYMTVTPGPITGFLGFNTSQSTVAQTWHMYTGGFINVLTFDSPLYFGYHSRFVSGIGSIIQSGGGPCSNDAVPSPAAGNYQYICDSAYDTVVTQAEFSPCLGAPGDPTNGQVVPTFADCVGFPGQPTAKSASYKAQDEYGQKSLSLPLWSGKNQYGYQTMWSQVTLHKGNGFTPPGAGAATFNAYSATPPLAGTVRQGFKEAPTSANPFVSNTAWDAALTGNIWGAPQGINPDSPQIVLDSMTTSTRILSNFTPGCTNCISYTPPAGTVQTFRYTFRTDIRWQTGQPFTAFDAAFSYVAWMTTGTPPGAGLAPVTGVKVTAANVMDVNVEAVGPFTQLFLSSTIIPTRFWVDPAKCTPAQYDGFANAAIAATTAAAFGTAWTNIQPCIDDIGSVQTSGTGNSPVGIFLRTGSSVDATNKVIPSYDPIASTSILSHCGTGNNAVPDCGSFVGSDAWECISSGGIIGSGCSSSGNEHVAPGGTFTFTRYGLGTTPGGSLNAYFRSAGNLALWAWTGNTGDFSTDFFNFGIVAGCFGKALGTAGCVHWQQGIGAPGGSSIVTVFQAGEVQRFVAVNWVSPFNWVSSPPQGITAFPPTLHEGAATLRPASVAGCASAYPVGGYDC